MSKMSKDKKSKYVTIYSTYKHKKLVDILCECYYYLSDKYSRSLAETFLGRILFDNTSIRIVNNTYKHLPYLNFADNIEKCRVFIANVFCVDLMYLEDYLKDFLKRYDKIEDKSTHLSTSPVDNKPITFQEVDSIPKSFDNPPDDPPVEEINNKGDKYEFVNHPKHYNEWSMEVIDMMEKIYGIENTIMWCEMTAYKYAMRMGFKPTDDIQQEIDKRNWYLNKAKELKQKLN